MVARPAWRIAARTRSYLLLANLFNFMTVGVFWFLFRKQDKFEASAGVTVSLVSDD